jgi:hypothetical protein
MKNLILILIFINYIIANCLTNDEINDYAKSYLTELAQMYGGNDLLNIYEIECIPDFSSSEKKSGVNYYNVNGKVSNLGINKRIISGRFNFKLALKKSVNIFKPNEFEIIKDETSRIELTVDDKLSKDLKDALVKNYVDLNYNNPLNINIVNTEQDIYEAIVDNYVTIIIDGYIVYIKISFEPTEKKIENIGPFIIHSSQWIQKTAQEIGRYNFPENEDMVKDLKIFLFNNFEKEFQRVNGNKKVFSWTSTIDKIYKSKLVKAANNRIELEVELKYKLGRMWGWNSYKTKIKTLYEFELGKKMWKVIKEELTIIEFNAI